MKPMRWQSLRSLFSGVFTNQKGTNNEKASKEEKDEIKIGATLPISIPEPEKTPFEKLIAKLNPKTDILVIPTSSLSIEELSKIPKGTEVIYLENLVNSASIVRYGYGGGLF